MTPDELLELLVLVGYSPDGKVREKKRKSVEEVLTFNGY